ncbi:hypothetical protein BJX68DRAFT_237997 [Aspergillus pseudodeflectus]|uniref:Zn(2)-C6 fungal-type domain-containing protein n=1 Tax=Aspergillus pseudodeflectus TaxID=176178 RepID=A0ABR4KAS7_9EURO
MAAPTSHALRSCVACKSKKRQCDKLLPSCSRCIRVEQPCLYMGYMELVISERCEVKSPFACLTCKKAKRPCSNDMPRCSRCTRLDLACEYNVKLAYIQNTLPSREGLPSRDGIAPMTGAISLPYTEPVTLTVLEPTPGHNYPIENRTYTSSLINHFCSYSFVPVSSTVPNSLAVHLRTAWMRHAMVDPCLFHSTLFSASAHIDNLHNVPESRQTTYHSMQTVRLLRQKLEDPITRGNYETAAAALALALFNMRLDRHEIALTHRSGLMKVLEFLKGDGQHLAELVSLTKMMLLIFSMIAPQDPEFPLSYAGAAHGLVYSTPSLAPTPSGILESILGRDALAGDNSALTSLARSTIQGIINYIVDHSQMTHGTAHDPQIPTPRAHPAEAVKDTTILQSSSDIDLESQHTATTRDINRCLQFAATLFHHMLGNSQQTPAAAITPIVTATDPPPNSRDELLNLTRLLRRVGFTAWLQHAPEGYIWICLTAAASAVDTNARSGFIMMAMPVLLALETTELAVTRQAWVCFSWLERARNLCQQQSVEEEGSPWAGPVLYQSV